MDNSAENVPRPKTGRMYATYPILIVTASLIAIVATFLLANSGLEVGAKTRGFSAIIGSFLVVCVLFYFWQGRKQAAGPFEPLAEFEHGDIDRQLTALDEANEFFAGALRAADTFRLIASRIKKVVPFQTIELLLMDQTRADLIVTEIDGTEVEGRKGLVKDLDNGIAGRCFLSRCVETGYERLSIGDAALPSVAIPLMHGLDVFGIFQLYFDQGYEIADEDLSTFEAVGSRVAPLMLSSIALERSQANALTDATTDLPNERAFYVVLENQIAEAMRNRDDRPLTILAIDIKEFDNINRRFGHAAGDRVLNFVAQTVKDNLRQMDFFARSIGDEFLAILPTASKEVSHEVIARIHTGFFGRKLKLTETDTIEIDLNFGWAAFGVDGETSDQLLGVARLRKEQSKSVVPSKVLWFSNELTN